MQCGTFQVRFDLIEVVGNDCASVPEAGDLVERWFSEHGLDAQVSKINVDPASNVAWGHVTLDQLIDESSRKYVLNDLNTRQDQLVCMNNRVIRVRINVARPPDAPSQARSRCAAD
jgi:hypothetical protein